MKSEKKLPVKKRHGQGTEQHPLLNENYIRLWLKWKEA